MHSVKCYLMGKMQPRVCMGLGFTVPLLLSWAFLPLRFNFQFCPSQSRADSLTSWDEQLQVPEHSQRFQLILFTHKQLAQEGMQGQGDRGDTSMRISCSGVQLCLWKDAAVIPPPRHRYCHSTQNLEAKPVLIKARTTTQQSQRPNPSSASSALFPNFPTMQRFPGVP